MPLKKGSSKKVVSKNVSEMVGAYRKKKKIGHTKPKSPEHARRIAVAAAMKKAGRSRK